MNIQSKSKSYKDYILLAKSDKKWVLKYGFEKAAVLKDRTYWDAENTSRSIFDQSTPYGWPFKSIAS